MAKVYLGIGDQGIGGMDIPVAKLMVYTLCGGIEPTRTLPVFLDVGTNNQDLLNDPMYLGCPHPRIKSITTTILFVPLSMKSINNFRMHFSLGRLWSWQRTSNTRSISRSNMYFQ